MSNSTLAAVLRNLRSRLAAHERREDSDEQLLHAFTSRRDDGAFAALVRRHGPMVLHVCRRVLDHEQDAEDAFQATFLVLAQSAATLRDKTRLASFLHGIAYRTAMKAKQSAARRRKHEGSLGALTQPRSPANPADEMSWREVRALFDEEITRLPEKYRIVFVLFYLEDLSREETARQLGLKDFTVANRLAEARKRLKQRLARRGVELTAVLAATALATPMASAVPAGLMASTTEAALAMIAGENMTGLVSASVAKLFQGTTTAMMVSKVKMAAAVLLAVSLLTVATSGSLVFLHGRASGPLAATAEPPAAKADDKPKAASPKRETTTTVEVRGRVLDPDGKPKAGAKLLLLGEDKKIVELGITAADGRFSVSIPKEAKNRRLIARTDDTGIAIRWAGSLKAENPVEMRLVKDQPVHGRVVNTEGKPVPGVRVAASNVHVYTNNSLDEFLAFWKNRQIFDNPFSGGEQLGDAAGVLFAATTDAKGRFVLRGLGVERFVPLRFTGAGIADTESWIVTRPGFDAKSFNKKALDNMPGTLRERGGGERQLDGSDVTIVAEPEKILHGAVKESDTGKGRPGVLVQLTRREGEHILRLMLKAHTDAQGRFEESTGARKAKRYMLEVAADTTAGYMPCQVWADDTPGYQPITADIAVKKGVLVTGKMIDGATGKAIDGSVQIAALPDNPFLKDFPKFDSSAWFPLQQTGADGRFRTVTIPGPVLLMGGPNGSETKFKSPAPDPKYPEYFKNIGGLSYTRPGGGISPVQGNYCKVLAIEPDAKVVQQDIVLERASVLPVCIQDADGKPLRGFVVGGSWPQPCYSGFHCYEAECPVYEIEPGKPRFVVFFHAGRKLAGTLTLKGGEKMPVVKKLSPAASIKGWLLDEAGKPLAGVVVHLNYRQQAASEVCNALHGHWGKPVVTNADGTFAFDDVIPQQKFELSFRHGTRKFQRAAKPPDPTIQIEPGERHDLGAIKVTRVTD